MPRITEQAKQRNIERVWLTIKRYAPNGVTESEISDYTGIQRRTLNNYLRDLFDEGKIYKDSLIWLPTDYQETKLLTVDLTPAEAYTLYLGSRLLVKQHDKRNELAEKALLQLADKLVSDEKVGSEIAQAARELARRPADPTYQSIFEAMVKSYLSKTPVTILYKPLNATTAYESTFCTYLIEPSAIGYATYVIGHCSKWNKVIAYKMERIQVAEPQKGQSYRIDKEFPGLDILRNSWSIVIGEKTTRVVLRFSPDVRERVLETQWHPSQDHEDDPEKEGWLRWWVDVAGTMDLEPWIRSWGSDVEVLEPVELRGQIIRDFKRSVQNYGIGNLMTIPLCQRLWAKTSKDKRETHPLICHLIDVGTVAHVIWTQAMAQSLRQQMAQALKLDLESAGKTIAFWIALHDLGKACPSFQQKHKPAIPQLKEVGLTFLAEHEQRTFYHAMGTTRTLEQILVAETAIDLKYAKQIGRALGGHHGFWPTSKELRDQISIEDIGSDKWDDARIELVRILRALFIPAAVKQLGEGIVEENAFLTLFSGFTSVADWIGSMEEYFPYEEVPLDITEYSNTAVKRAKIALQSLQWDSWQPPYESAEFDALFPFTPNETQQAAISLAKSGSLNQPSLVIIEAATGSGKTEAALYLADHWMEQLQQQGMYVAMPTMATSNQMHDRVRDFLQSRYPERALAPLLIHSQARWMQKAPPPTITIQEEIGQEESNNFGKAAIREMGWFLPRKRSLLVPFGVGTVDQSLLGILQTRHFFVRLFGLSNKTVIFDEVHAYDTYMSTLFEQLLRWLRAANTSVVLLSATLPAKTRQRLLQAYTGLEQDAPSKEQDETSEDLYPCITWANKDDQNIIKLTQSAEERSIHLHWIDTDTQTIVQQVKNLLQTGGCAAIICNRVKRAQELFRALWSENEKHQFIDPSYLILFHARYPFQWRDAIENDVRQLFGKPSVDGVNLRPEKAIVVATQVIEQSLDLDFDVMFTDLAPIDFLLQRAGRLQRHQRSRHPAFPMQDLYLAVHASKQAHTDMQMTLPDVNNDKLIYAPYIMLRSYLALQQQPGPVKLPVQTSTLIEAVYGENEATVHPAAQKLTASLPAPVVATLAELREAMSESDMTDARKAKEKRVPSPNDKRLLKERSSQLEEDSPELHADAQALTRLGPPSVNLVCLHRSIDGVYTEPDGKGILIDLDLKPDSDTTKDLVQHAVGVNHPAVFHYFINHETVPKGWREHSLLQRYYAVKFDDNGTYQLPDTPYLLRLSRRYGLEITNLQTEATTSEDT